MRASHQEIVKSLDGTWRPELLLVLKQEVDMYDTYRLRLAECDRELEAHLHRFATKDPPPATPAPAAAIPKGRGDVPTRLTKRNKKPQGQAPRFDLGGELRRISGVDLTQIDGIDVVIAQTVISEVGVDMHPWKDEGHFASWLGLSPDNRITGDRIIGKGTRPVVSRAATALRMAASTLLRSQSYLGAQYRRFRTKLGAPKAITAMAHKLAVLVYRMLKFGHEYVDQGARYYEERHRQQQIALLKKRAAKLGLQVIQPEAA
jgi:transposase